MPRRISLEPHLSIDELENRYRQSKDAIAQRADAPWRIARTHYQTIWCGFVSTYQQLNN
jgi:hypothetical protein